MDALSVFELKFFFFFLMDNVIHRSLWEELFSTEFCLKKTFTSPLKIKHFYFSALMSMAFVKFHAESLVKSFSKLSGMNNSFRSSAKSGNIESRKTDGKSLMNIVKNNGPITDP